MITIGLLLASCGGAEPASSPSPPAATAIDAKELYEVNCAVCHGPSRQGVPDIGPALTSESLARLTDDEIRGAILNGRPNTAMAGFEGRLSPEQIEALIQLIKYSSP